MNPQICCDLGHALTLWRTHTPSHISLDGLAVQTVSTTPSSPLGDRNGEASIFLAEGEQHDKRGEKCPFVMRVHLALARAPQKACPVNLF